MAIERKITRTIEENTCTVLCIDLTNNQTENRTFIIGKVKTPTEALAVIKRKFDNETRLALHVLNMETSTALYEMSEVEFIRHAHRVEKPTADEKQDEIEN